MTQIVDTADVRQGYDQTRSGNLWRSLPQRVGSAGLIRRRCWWWGSLAWSRWPPVPFYFFLSILSDPSGSKKPPGCWWPPLPRHSWRLSEWSKRSCLFASWLRFKNSALPTRSGGGCRLICPPTRPKRIHWAVTGGERRTGRCGAALSSCCAPAASGRRGAPPEFVRPARPTAAFKRVCRRAYLPGPGTRPCTTTKT